MASLDELRSGRLRKLESLRSRGINPYPIEAHPSEQIQDALGHFSKLAKRAKPIILVGRVRGVRAHGGSVFVDLDDGTGSIQLFFKRDTTGDEAFELFTANVDIGDFVEVKGKLFLTKRKEKTLLVSSWHMLVKSLRPLPDKWHGLENVEERFRKRYLDTLQNETVRKRFMARSTLITETRKYLDKAGYLEVETPILQPIYGGASAEAFTTRHNALDMTLYLRISDELYLKRLLIGGFPKIYEINKDFRNEGIDAVHNPEFTMLEFYTAWSDAKKSGVFVEKMLKTLARGVLGKLTFSYSGKVIDLSKKFRTTTFYDLLRRHALILSPEHASLDDLMLKGQQLGVTVPAGAGREKLMDAIYKKVCRPKLIEPTFVTDYPVGYLPLAKRTEKNPDLVDAFQLIIGGIEIVKGYSELNDPLDQFERMKKEEDAKKSGDEEAQRLDTDFIEALEYGMPPAGGVGIGLDRLAMLFTDAENIREVLFFPTLKPKGEKD